MSTTRTYSLSIEVHADEGGYLAYFPALPGCQTWGETYEAAIKNAEEALTLYIETRLAHGDSLPEDKQPHRPVSLALVVNLPAAA
jgi:predicted RNase H-like HicB family nuclease